MPVLVGVRVNRHMRVDRPNASRIYLGIDPRSKPAQTGRLRGRVARYERVPRMAAVAANSGAIGHGREGRGMKGTAGAELRELLQKWEPPTGPNGFEAMVAVALAEVSGLPIRLARSGSQFGRDGLSAPGDFVIAFEAKRYSNTPTLQELTTKAALATDDLDDRVEIWACAVSADLGDLAARLSEILDRAGMTLLALDWPTGGLSPLAALLAGARTKVCDWARSIGRHADAVELDRLLREVELDGGFPPALARMKAELTHATAGMAALAVRNADWARNTLAEPPKARQIFGQAYAVNRVAVEIEPHR